jgi:hypothetical protein
MDNYKLLKKTLNEIIKNKENYNTNDKDIKELFNDAYDVVINKTKERKELKKKTCKKFYNKINEEKNLYKCVCGKHYNYYNKFNHNNSIYHKKYLETQND